eukprot:15037030-Heterocapsa_arctica.AAC.1
MLRRGSYRWRMRAALADIVQEELVVHQGGEVPQALRDHSSMALRRTIMQHLSGDLRGDGAGESGDSPSLQKRREKLQMFCKEILDILNGDWSEPRL